MSKYTIRYNHQSNDTASSIRAALRIIRREAGVSRLHKADVPDGIYCYRSKSDKDRDDTGASAFAVIDKEIAR